MPIPVYTDGAIVSRVPGNLDIVAFSDGRRVIHISLVRGNVWYGYEVDEAAFLSFLDSQSPPSPVAQS